MRNALMLALVLASLVAAPSALAVEAPEAEPGEGAATACVGLPCDLINLVCYKVFHYYCVR